MRPDCRKEQKYAAPAKRSGAAANRCDRKDPVRRNAPRLYCRPAACLVRPRSGVPHRKRWLPGMDANGRQVFRLVSVKARARPAFPFLSKQWQMAGALAHTAAVPHGIDYPFPFSFRQAEHLPFDFYKV